MSAHGKSESYSLASSPSYRLQGAQSKTPLLLRPSEMEAGHAAIKLADWRSLPAPIWLTESLEGVAKAICYTAR